MNSREKAIQFCMQLGYRENSIRVDDLMALLDQHAAEQRKICAHDGSKAAVEYKGKYIGDHVHFACLNAVEKSDDK